jgi:hypothetical protein
MITIIVGKGSDKEFLFNNFKEGNFTEVNYDTDIQLDERHKSWLRFLDLGCGFEYDRMSHILYYSFLEGFDSLFVSYPENYLHPSTQVELGDLAIEINKVKDSFWVTNSEHMILRLLRRIREFTEGDPSEHLITGTVEFTKENLKIIYAPQNKTLRMDDLGEFIDRWPCGFFQERMEELF